MLTCPASPRFQTSISSLSTITSPRWEHFTRQPLPMNMATATVPTIDIVAIHKCSKYMVVDRKIGVLSSNNIQDRVNVEMMTHLEGPIVDSLYDMALLSWNMKMDPPLPLLLDPEPVQTDFAFGQEHQHIQDKDIKGSKMNARNLLAEHHQYADQEQNKSSQGTWDADNQSEAYKIQTSLSASENALNEHLNTGTKIKATELTSQTDHPFHPHILHSRHEPVPMALVNRRPNGRPGHDHTNYPQVSTRTQPDSNHTMLKPRLYDEERCLAGRFQACTAEGLHVRLCP